MSEELELTGGSAGIDRRDFIRKTAIVGGMVWAAPMIQSIGSPAFAFSPNGEGDPNGGDISYVAFVIANGTTRYKFDGTNCSNLDSGLGQVVDQCTHETFATDYATADQWTGSTAPTWLTTDCNRTDGKWVFTIVASEPYTFKSGAVKSGQICNDVDISSDGKTLTANPISQS